MNLFAELRRRNVFRVAGVYAVVAWLLAQAAALLENALGMPSWFDTMVVCLLLLGLPVAVIFAWAFEMTPQGVKRTADVRPEESITGKTGRKLDYAIIAGLALVVVVVVADRLTGGGAPQARTAAIGATLADNSIAVLPFVDMSPDGDQEYFADGISEELLNVLAKVKTLQVAGRTSSFAFKNDNRDLREIGELLKVAHILEGSVRKSGDRVRITAQLIKAENGYHMWSDTFDGELTDIFALQDKVANAIFVELKKELNIAADEVVAPAPAPRANVDAYEFFLKARELINQVGGEPAYEDARRLLDQAIAIDPDYAPSLAWRAYAEASLSDAWGGVGDTPIAEALPVVKKFAELAIAADPASPDAQFALGAYHAGLYISEGKGHLNQVIETYRKAVALRPNFPQAQRDLAGYLAAKGEYEEAIDILESVLEHDPGHRDANESYIDLMIGVGHFEEAEVALARWMAIHPDPVQEKLYQAYMLIEQGRSAEALKIVEAVETSDPELQQARRRLIYFAHYDMGDADWVLENAPSPISKAFGLLVKGDAEQALAIVSGLPNVRNNPHGVITTYNQFLAAAGKYDEIVQYYDENIETPEAVIAEVDACACGGVDVLVEAMRKTGHKDANAVLKLWGDMAARKSLIYARSYAYHKLESSRALFNGDNERARTEFARAMDLGWRSTMFATGGVDYKDLPPGAEFDALQARMLGLINDERVKAGIAPLSGETAG